MYEKGSKMWLDQQSNEGASHKVREENFCPRCYWSGVGGRTIGTKKETVMFHV